MKLRPDAVEIDHTARPANRLALEKSPYLLQHAHNPVDWRPWGDEALDAARRENKPLFLSIGYATCHWCHVMERESFENEAVARLLNAHFIPVKVDREERPDIDAVYMASCQLMTGSGGWPLSVFATPDGTPFYTATYIPPHGRAGRLGMIDLLPRLAELWRANPGNAHEVAARVRDALRQARQVAPGQPDDPAAKLHASILTRAETGFAALFDAECGGFGRAPKFPSPHTLLFLLRRATRTGNAGLLAMAEKTLRRMRQGGVYDHVGGGFHRYATDRAWLVPHFEKMLYDQATHLMAYTEAWQATGDSLWRATAQAVAAYVLRDLRAGGAGPGGAFYSAEDADSEGVEGKFYVFTLDGAASALAVAGLTPEETALALDTLGFAAAGNYHDEATGQRTGTNIPHLPRPVEVAARAAGMPPHELDTLLDRALVALFAARAARPRPFLDDKVLADWNGLMIAALAFAGRALAAPELVRAAGEAARFVLDRMRAPDGRLVHRYRDGQAAVPGMLDDYAFMAWGCLELHQATLDAHWLRTATELAAILCDLFKADDNGGFYLTTRDGEALAIRPREMFDGAHPSGNAAAAYTLIRLARLAGRPEWEETAKAVLTAVSREMAETPTGFGLFLCALDLALQAPTIARLTGMKRKEEDAQDPARAFLDAAGRVHAPEVLFLQSDDAVPAFSPAALAATPAATSAPEGPLAHVCRDARCLPPVATPEALADLLSTRITAASSP